MPAIGSVFLEFPREVLQEKIIFMLELYSFKQSDNHQEPFLLYKDSNKFDAEIICAFSENNPSILIFYLGGHAFNNQFNFVNTLCIAFSHILDAKRVDYDGSPYVINGNYADKDLESSEEVSLHISYNPLC